MSYFKYFYIVFVGVLAQEFVEVLPEAVTETGDVELPNGEKIDKFLVVDKVRLIVLLQPERITFLG